MEKQGEQNFDELASFHASLLDILQAAMQVDGATKGNVQLLDETHSGLCIVTQIGFNEAFLQLFETVRIDDPSSCARAWRLKRRIIVSDINLDPLFASYLSIARDNKFQAVQSTPIIVADGSVQGVFSTHYPMAHFFSNTATKVLDACAIKMAKLIMKYGMVESPVVQKKPRARAASHHRPCLHDGRRH